MKGVIWKGQLRSENAKKRSFKRSGLDMADSMQSKRKPAVKTY